MGGRVEKHNEEKRCNQDMGLELEIEGDRRFGMVASNADERVRVEQGPGFCRLNRKLVVQQPWQSPCTRWPGLVHGATC